MIEKIIIALKNLITSNELFFLSFRLIILLASILTLLSIYGSNFWRYLSPWLSGAIFLLIHGFYILEGRDDCEHLPNYQKAPNPLMEYHQIRKILEVQPGPSSRLLLKKIVVTRRLAIFSLVYYCIHWLIIWCIFT